MQIIGDSLVSENVKHSFRIVELNLSTGSELTIFARPKNDRQVFIKPLQRATKIIDSL